MPIISFHHLSKQYGAIRALEDFTATALPGRITAFLGPNGAGKTTSMRVLLGLSEASTGAATFDGTAYRDLTHPLHVVGAVLDQGFHPGRTARNQLRVIAAQAGIRGRARVDEMLGFVDLESAADRKVGGFSLGMRQRLALASALLPNPSALVLDEPFNGLDPDGIRATRLFLRDFSNRGGTVLLSSHLLAEIANNTDDVIVINHGRLVTAGPVTDIVAAGDDLEDVFQSLIHPERTLS